MIRTDSGIALVDTGIGIHAVTDFDNIFRLFGRIDESANLWSLKIDRVEG